MREGDQGFGNARGWLRWGRGGAMEWEWVGILHKLVSWNLRNKEPFGQWWQEVREQGMQVSGEEHFGRREQPVPTPWGGSMLGMCEEVPKEASVASVGSRRKCNQRRLYRTMQATVNTSI